MSKKQELYAKLFRKPYPKNFTIKELDKLMNYYGYIKYQGGRGSSVKYYNETTKRVLQFDAPHPGTELYKYHIDKVKAFINSIEMGE